MGPALRLHVRLAHVLSDNAEGEEARVPEESVRADDAHLPGHGVAHQGLYDSPHEPEQAQQDDGSPKSRYQADRLAERRKCTS